MYIWAKSNIFFNVLISQINTFNTMWKPCFKQLMKICAQCELAFVTHYLSQSVLLQKIFLSVHAFSWV